MIRILVTHAYSSLNSGDGFLVDETVGAVRAIWPTAGVTVIASHPDTFEIPGAMIVSSKPGSWASVRDYLRTLTRVSSYDLVVAVGGGYLRARSALELLKMAIVHAPQLVATSLFARNSIYMPQSIGPFDPITGSLMKRLLERVDQVYVRDDRSMSFLGDQIASRSMDLAVLSDSLSPRRTRDVLDRPVLSVRRVDDNADAKLAELADELRPFDSLVQSSVAGNHDLESTHKIRPASLIEHATDDGRSPRRVVIAVRLHAALMALHQGHYVIHLAYERKGFGAFQDLGLEEFVHNVHSFDRAKVLSQCAALIQSASDREQYDRRLTSRAEARESVRESLFEKMSDLANEPDA